MSSTSVPMLPASADLVTTWAFLEEGMDHIMTKLQTGVSYSKYMSLYTSAYDYCASSTMHSHVDHSGMMIGSSGANLMGSDLYNNLIQYFIIHLKGLRASAETLQDEALLQYYSAEWLRYTTGANYINRLFTYLIRHWVKQERDEGRNTVYPVYTLALMQWKNNLFIPIQQEQTKLASAILRLIENQRNGDMIDQGLIKRVVDSFVSLGLDDTDTNKECFDIYREHFEAPFIDATEKYYTQESESFLASNTIEDYLKKVEKRLKEEEDRVDRYLNSQTRKPVIAKCEQVLIRQHAQVMWDSFQGLLDSDREEDLQRMSGLLARIPEGLEPLRKRFEEHVKKAGWAAVENLVGGRTGASDGLDPRAYVNALLEVHNKNSKIVTRSFGGEAGFVTSLDEACREFVNRNAATGLTNAMSPELLAKYADLLLRKNSKLAEDDLEYALGRVMTLFQYIEDKDAFQTFFTSRLSKRLIHGLSASDENETIMISKLKEACGFEYTNKLQRMFTDMNLSKVLTDAFKAHMEQNHDGIDISFSIMVLRTSVWPLTPPPRDFIIPFEILTTCERFQNYYQTKHSGRKLTWLWNYSRCELRTNYTNQKYILMTSAYQMSVLVLYNNSETWGFEEIKEATGLGGEVLSQVLGLLVKAKVLICDDDTGGQGGGGKEGGQYDLNPNFRSKKIRVNLNLPIREAAKNSDVSETVDNDRKYVILITINRIMKYRRKLKKQELIREVISQLYLKFSPKIPDIKKVIETMLEKEYIERVEGTTDTFAFVP